MLHIISNFPFGGMVADPFLYVLLRRCQFDRILELVTWTVSKANDIFSGNNLIFSCTIGFNFSTAGKVAKHVFPSRERRPIILTYGRNDFLLIKRRKLF